MHLFFFNLLAIALLLNSTCVFAAESVSLEHCGLVSQKSSSTMKMADFVQQRVIKGLTKPLISSGNFQLYPENKIIWETTAPIYSKVTISKSGFEISSTNNETAQSESFNQSQFREVSSLLLSLHSLSLATIESTTLAQKFFLECFQKPNNEFTLIASPRDDDLSKLLKSITLTGRTTPSEITIIDGRGDKTTVQLLKIQEIDEHSEQQK